MTEKWQADAEYMSYVQDLLETEEVKKLAKFTQHMNSTRLEHSISVSYNSFKLAKNGAAMRGQRLELDYCMTCFTMIGAQQNLMKAPMPTCILGSQSKMPKKSQNYLI